MNCYEAILFFARWLMTNNKTKFELPKNIERYLAALSKLYALDGLVDKQEIIVNAAVRVHEEWSSDNWNGGTYGHALYLVLPETLYLRCVKNKDNLQKQIKKDINKVHSIQNEFIEEVFLEMEVMENHDWRTESGLLLSGKRIVLPDDEKRIWGNDVYRVFLSHKNEIKKEASQLKSKLSLFGISCFVAHKDIHPTREWQDEIEKALYTMDAFVALMTDGFHDSEWTDQEVGFAVGRGVPLLSVKLGKDPYGFIGKFQALSCSWPDAHKEITKILLKHERMLNAYIVAVQRCGEWNQGNALSELLPAITALSDQQVNKLLSAFNENTEVSGSFGFNGRMPTFYGDGLSHHLRRITGDLYDVVDDKLTKVGMVHE